MRWIASFLILLASPASEDLLSQSPPDSLDFGRISLQLGNEQLKRQSYDSALVNLSQSSRLLKGRDGEGYLRSESCVAQALHARGMVDSASGVLSRALALVGQSVLPVSRARAEAYALQSLIHSYYGRSDSAIALAERSLAIRSSLFGPAHSSLSADYYTLGVAFKNRGSYEQALASLRKAVELFADDGRPNASRANISVVLGNTLREMGRFEEAFAEFQRAYEELARQGLERTHTMATAMCYEAYAKGESGSLTEALSLYQRCLALIEEIDPSNQTMLLVVRIQLGEVYAKMGDVEKGIDFFENTLRQSISEERPPAMIAELRQYAAKAYMQAGKHATAIRYAESALALKEGVLGNDNPDVASAHELIADLYTGAKEYPRALAETHEAIRVRSLLPGSSARPDLANLWIKKGELERLLGRTGAAEQSVRRALSHEEGTAPRNPLLLSRAFETLADIYRDRRRGEEAGKMYDTAVAMLFPDLEGSPAAADIEGDLTKGAPFLRLLRKQGLVAESLPAARGPARGAAATGGPVGETAGGTATFRNALSKYLLASEVLYRLRSGFDSEGAKIRTLEENADVIERGIRLACDLAAATGDQEYARRGLELAEGNRAGLLMEGLRSSRPEHLGGVPVELQVRERKLRRQLTILDLSLARTLQETIPDTGRSMALAGAISEKREELWHVRDELRQFPNYEPSSPDFAFSVSRLQASLDDSTLLLEYFAGESGYCFAVDNRSVRIRRIGSARRMRQAAEGFLTGIRTLDSKGTAAAGRGLQSQILGPVESLLRGHPRLIIIPDRELSRIPFEALRSGGAAGRYLVASHEITYALSARMLLDQEGREERGGEVSFAGFAPIFADSIPPAAAPPALLASLEEGAVRSLTLDGKQLRALKYTKGEVAGIASEFTRHGVSATTFLFDRATKSAFASASLNARYLHVATHGVVNEKDPRLSALLFAQGPDSGTGSGEALYAAEAYNLTLNANLVVLSCCDGGVGRYVTGEGVYALARGFLHAGARSISYSLWKVMDRQTSDLMHDFYGELLTGKSYARALQIAKLRMLSRPETSAPYHWAGFVLVGNGRLPGSPHEEFSRVK